MSVIKIKSLKLECVPEATLKADLEHIKNAAMSSGRGGIAEDHIRAGARYVEEWMKINVRGNLKSVRESLMEEGYHFPNETLTLIEDMIVTLGGGDNEEIERGD